MRQARFALVELCALPIPRDWPQFGTEFPAGWARRGWQGGIAHTRLNEGALGKRDRRLGETALPQIPTPAQSMA